MGSYSNLGLYEPTPGDPSVADVWGTILNTNDQILDNAISGVLTKTVAGNANVVLTSSPGAADEDPNSAFIFTGALTGNIVVLWPLGKTRRFVVTNNTTGAFTLSLGVNNGSGQPQGTTVQIPQGSTSTFSSDGTNVASAPAAPGGTASGDLSGSYPGPVVSGIQGKAVSSTAPVDQQVLRWGAKNSLYVPASALPWAVATGSVDAIDAAYAPTVNALYDGLTLSFRSLGGNVSNAPTFSPDTLTAAPITARGGLALLPGDTAGEPVVRYDLGSNRWELLNPQAVPYDFAFNAGLESNGSWQSIAVQTYSEVVAPRAMTAIGEQLYMGTAPQGTPAIFDILKNGVSIYATKPQVAVGQNAGTAGVLNGTVTFAAGDRITFTCTQVGSTTAGAEALFTLKAAT